MTVEWAALGLYNLIFSESYFIIAAKHQHSYSDNHAIGVHGIWNIHVRNKRNAWADDILFNIVIRCDADANKMK